MTANPPHKPQTWGGFTNELDTAIHLARVAGNTSELERLEQALAMVRAACAHYPHPTKPQCLKCGAPDESAIMGRPLDAGPGVRKINPYPLPKVSNGSTR